jgi:hypothetical protein
MDRCMNEYRADDDARLREMFQFSCYLNSRVKVSQSLPRESYKQVIPVKQ